MREYSQLIRIAWFAMTFMEGLVVVALLRRRLATKYPVFAVGLTLSFGVSCWLIFEWLTGGRVAYRSAWELSRAANFAVLVALTLDAYLLQARHLRRFRQFGALLVALFLLLSAVAVLLTSGVAADGFHGYPALILFARHFDLACLVFLLVSRGFFAYMRVSMKPNVVRHSWLLSLLLFGNGIGHAATYPGRPWLTLAGLTIMYAAGIAAYAGWLRFRPQGEHWDPPADMTTEEAREHDHHYLWVLATAARDAWRARRGYVLSHTWEGRPEADPLSCRTAW